MKFKQYITEAAPLKFDLVDGRYMWVGPVKPENVKVKVRKAKWSELATAAAKWAGARLFYDYPIEVEIIWDNSIGKSVGAWGVSSTGEGGHQCQVYISSKRAGAYGAHAIVSTVVEELVHTWQRRNGWGRPNVEIEYDNRPEEVHAKDITQLLSNEFTLEQGPRWGIEASPWFNTPKYFEGMIKRFNFQQTPGTYVKKPTYEL